jgi:formylglycine-generating enzyme required for sulfatase activity
MYLTGFAALLLATLAIAAGLVFANAVSIEIQPDDAAAAGTVTVVEGRAIAIGDAVYSLAGLPVIVVAAPGFRDLRLALRPDERGRRISVTLEPLPGRIAAVTRPGHDETRWAIDGQLIAVGQAVDGEVEAGRRLLRVDHPWHPAVERALDVERGRTTTLTIELPPLDGGFDLASEPAGASVTINGEAAGTTPLARAAPGGRYDIVVALDGYDTIEESVELTRGAAMATRRYRLQPVAATVVVSVEPGGGDLLLDGRRIEPGRSQAVATGRDHTVTYLRDGWRGAKETFRLAPGETRRLALKLERDLGTVEVHTEPAAQIVVDGTTVGEGTATLSLPTVPHRIELRKAGYRTIVRTVTPTSGRRTVLREQVVPELAARLAEAPRRYRNAAGSEMLLFEPLGGFTMGAPRHQEGQRANEFEKRIVLGKRFYAGMHEVTNGQFRKFRSERAGPDDLPVTGIAWRDAAAFCNWLSGRENLAPFYRIAPGGPVAANPTADGYRLLTEAEWEWLARSAGRPKPTVFTWGDDPVVPKQAGNIADESANGLTRYYVPNYNDGHATIAPVGRFPAEPSGLFDMTGNVGEWVHDYYVLAPPAPGETFVDPVGPAAGDSHVVKGSSWRSGTRTALRASYREGLGEGRDDVGFRIGRYLYGAETGAAR